MSLATIRNLIARPVPEVDATVFLPMEGREFADRIQETLTTYQEAKQFDLSEADKLKLREHLLWAGRQVTHLVEYDDQHGRSSHLHGQRHIRLHTAIASELGMTPQQLQAATD